MLVLLKKALITLAAAVLIFLGLSWLIYLTAGRELTPGSGLDQLALSLMFIFGGAALPCIWVTGVPVRRRCMSFVVGVVAGSGSLVFYTGIVTVAAVLNRSWVQMIVDTIQPIVPVKIFFTLLSAMTGSFVAWWMLRRHKLPIPMTA